MIAWIHLTKKHQLDPLNAVQEYKRRFQLRTTRCAAAERMRLESYIRYLESQGKRWTKPRVIKVFARLRRRGKPLNHGSVAREANGVRDAALRYFGSWNKFLKAQGLDPWQISKRHFWTKSSIIGEIKKYARDGSVHPKDFPLKHYSTVHRAAALEFGTWHAALKAAGLKSLRAPWTQWTKAEVVRRIQRRARNGLGIGKVDVVRSEPGLAAAARIVMGKPWSLILQDLGLQGHKIVWSKKLLREEIRRFHLGRRSHLRGITRTQLYQAAQTFYGSWWIALKDAGVRARHGPPISWTKGEVLRRIRRRHREGRSLSGATVMKEDRSLYRTARRVLGKTWERAIRDLGYNDIASRMPWTNAALLREIRNHFMHKEISKGVTPRALRAAAWRRFGSMEKAKTLAFQSH